MTGAEAKWIWQRQNWPNFEWQEAVVQAKLAETRLLQGILLGKAGAVEQGREFTLDTLVANIVASSAIEDESLNVQSVRSSLAKRLGILNQQNYPTSDRSEGLAQMMWDALNNRHQPVSIERVCQWHRWLFTDIGWSLHAIRVGQLRGDEPMQVVSGRIDKPQIHFEAPPRDRLDAELSAFISWFNRRDAGVDPLLRAAIAHFWFVTLHPFDDGNGRITRALTDLALAQAEERSVFLYAMSASVLAQRNAYYSILEQSQRADMDITPWILWFLDTLQNAFEQALLAIDRTLNKTRFWQQFRTMDLSREQVKVLNRLLEGGNNNFAQGISAAQYQKVAKVSKATATRHLADLLLKGCVVKSGAGRSTRYQVVEC